MRAFFELNIGSIWNCFRREHFSFWMICAYFFFEYVRPHSIYTWLNFLPWAQVFIVFSAIGLLADSTKKWASSQLTFWLLSYLLIVVLSCIFAISPKVSWSNIADYYTWVVIYFLIINIVNTPKRFYIFLLVFLLASFKLSLFGAKTWTLRGFGFTDWGIQGPPGFFTNSGELAVQMVVFAPIAYQFAVSLKPYLSKLKYYLLLAIPMTGVMTVMGASSRGSQVALLFQLYSTFLKGRAKFGPVLLIAILCVGGWQILPDEQKQRFSNAGDDTTSRQRLLYWENGWQMIKDYPLLGVGYYNFVPYYEQHYSDDKLYDNAQLPHNIFIQVGTDTGFSGLFVYLMVIWACFKETAKIRKSKEKIADKPFYYNLSLGFDAALWGFVIAGQFVSIVYYPYLWIHAALVVALRNVALGPNNKQLIDKQKNKA